MTIAPTMPAITAASSESPPSVGDTVCTDWASTFTGNAPRLSTRASDRASPSLKLPVICTDPGEERLVDRRRRLDDVVEHDRQLATTGTELVPW